jgi:large subunit ribosomal protein L25
MSIPEKLVISVRDLQLEQQITAADVRLPEGATLLTDPESVVVTCHKVVEQELEEVPTGETAEPELIGRKPAEEGEEEA